MYSYGPSHIAVQKQDNQLEHIYSNYVRTQDVTLKTYRRRWMIGRSGERASGISVLAARHDDDDDDIYVQAISLMSRVLANGLKDRGSIPGQVIPKMVLVAALLITQHHEVRWSIPGDGVVLRCSSYWKGNLRVTLD